MKKFTLTALFVVLGLSTVGFAKGCCGGDNDSKPKFSESTPEYPKDKEPEEGNSSCCL